MNDFGVIYDLNRKLDQKFIKKYAKNEPLYFEKNCIEFLIELGELVNETKCFKYWTVKKPNKELVLEEYADCIIMIFPFFGMLDVNLDNLGEHQESDNILVVINYLYHQGTKLMTELSEALVKDIFVNLLYLGDLLELSKEEIIEATIKKQNKVEQRLNDEY